MGLNLLNPNDGATRTREILAVRWPVPLRRTESTSGINAAAVIIRQMLANMQEPIAMSSMMSIPIVRYALLDHPREDSVTAQHPQADALKAEQETLWNALVEAGDGLTFRDVMFGRQMQPFWCMPEMALSDTVCFDGTTDEQVGEPALDNSPFIKWDGALNLGGFISKQATIGAVVLREDGGMNRSWTKFRFPSFIRVLYSPGPEYPADFDYIRSFHVTWIEATNDGRTVESTAYQCYSLVGMARLRSSPEEEDFVRTYTTIGTPIHPPTKPWSCINDDWRVGEPGHDYALFYHVNDGDELSSQVCEFHRQNANRAAGMFSRLTNLARRQTKEKMATRGAESSDEEEAKEPEVQQHQGESSNPGASRAATGPATTLRPP
ncbi:hypothetical protein B0T16DRAFT_422424 [Cercophora newfieldiana]|uniref:Uncharacterized protein n=1 Tax=Cercophora newfieldiana TaxID=92897 RepID=A0AA40CHY3_9PEZI|nr:hypothetical protein B0T16DRAFT_422424 [Cercophora newfieldiana]